jgi:serine/threonine-protein kinase
MLTSRTLFLAKQSRDVMAKHLTDEAPGACDLNPDVPEAYGQILHRMLAKDPADRYQRATDLAADLDAVLAGRPPFHAAGFRGRSSCAPPPAPKPATKSSRRIVQPSARILLPSEIAQRQAERRLARKRRNWILIGSFAGFAVVVFLFLLPRLSCSPTPPAPPTRTPFREPPQSAPPPSAPVPPAPPLEPPPVETRKNGL